MIGDRGKKVRFTQRLALCVGLGLGLGALGGLARAETDADLDRATGDHLIERSRKAMGTAVSIVVWVSSDQGQEDAAVSAIGAGFDEIDRVDRLMTTWTDTSDVARINAAAGTGVPVPVDAEVYDCLERAIEGSRRSKGAFDVTVGSFAGVWKFDEDNDGTIPPADLVASRRKLVDWHDLVLDPKAHTARLRRAGQKITLGGIAKGYAVDRVAAILKERGFADFMVQAGGDLYVSGRRGDRHWRVGIRDPRGGRESYFAAVEIADHTFSTSGDYERYVIRDGRRYHHILDPRTGYPATGARSVTIMAKDATTAEVLSKTLFIWGPRRGMALIEKLPDVEAVVVDTHNKLHVSSGLKDKLILLKAPTDGL